MQTEKTISDLEKELAELRWQLDEANDTLEAIRTGQIDALVVKDDTGHQLYTLSSADQTYRVFIEKMREGAITLNEDGLILYCNSTFASLMKMPLSDVMAISFYDFVTEDHKSKFSNLFNRAREMESKGEITLLTKENQKIPFLLSLTSLELQYGKAIGIIATDLSAQKENERQIKQKNKELLEAQNLLTKLNDELEQRVEERTRELLMSREHFKFLADQIPVIVWTAKPDGEVNYFNKRWYDFTGLSHEESTSGDWVKVIHPEDQQKTLDAWSSSIREGNSYDVEYRFKSGLDGSYRWHSGKAVPFRNEKGDIITWFGICTDIDVQKMEMTRKDEFISMASHELKTPVTTLKAFTQILISMLAREQHDTGVDFLQKMDKQINKLTTLIADLLDATKVNAGVLHFSVELFDFNELMLETIEQMRLTSETHAIELELGESGKIFADRNRIGQVISNLITNAIKYSPQSGKIVVKTIKSDETMNFSVQDFGIGVPAGQQSKLFNRFFRATEVKTNTFPGLGLGLYISNEIVKRHAGTLTFVSEENKGSTFTVQLPLAKENIQAR